MTNVPGVLLGLFSTLANNLFHPTLCCFLVWFKSRIKKLDSIPGIVCDGELLDCTGLRFSRLAFTKKNERNSAYSTVGNTF